MSNPAETSAPTPAATGRKTALAPILVAWTLALVAAGAAIYQNQAANARQYENAMLTAKLEATQADLGRTTGKLEEAQAQVLALTAEVARFDPEEVARLEQAVSEAQANASGLRAELETAREALAEREAKIEERATNVLPPPPAIEVLAPPPLYGSADYGDPHVDIELDQYLTELLTILADDSKAPDLAAIHPLGVLYDVDYDLVLQGTVGDSQRYRVTERHTLNEHQDIVLDSLIIVDAPAGTNVGTRVQQALTNARGGGELDDRGLLSWEVGTKTITLRPTPTSDTARATLQISDSYKLPDTMQVYNRQ